jgi:2-iminobutanoate/2-iminopropanoate deaminase
MKSISVQEAPDAIGPYCHAMQSGNLVFCSGQTPLDPQTMELVGITIEDQTKRVLTNLSIVLSAIGLALGNVIKTTVYLKNMEDFKGMNKVYEEMFAGHKPSRSSHFCFRHLHNRGWGYNRNNKSPGLWQGIKCNMKF